MCPFKFRLIVYFCDMTLTVWTGVSPVVSGDAVSALSSPLGTDRRALSQVLSDKQA